MLISIGFRKVVATSVVWRCRGFRAKATGVSMRLKNQPSRMDMPNGIKLND